MAHAGSTPAPACPGLTHPPFPHVSPNFLGKVMGGTSPSFPLPRPSPCFGLGFGLLLVCLSVVAVVLFNPWWANPFGRLTAEELLRRLEAKGLLLSSDFEARRAFGVEEYADIRAGRSDGSTAAALTWAHPPGRDTLPPFPPPLPSLPSLAASRTGGCGRVGSGWWREFVGRWDRCVAHRSTAESSRRILFTLAVQFTLGDPLSPAQAYSGFPRCQAPSKAI